MKTLNNCTTNIGKNMMTSNRKYELYDKEFKHSWIKSGDAFDVRHAHAFSVAGVSSLVVSAATLYRMKQGETRNALRDKKNTRFTITCIR